MEKEVLIPDPYSWGRRRKISPPRRSNSSIVSGAVTPSVGNAVDDLFITEVKTESRIEESVLNNTLVSQSQEPNTAESMKNITSTRIGSASADSSNNGNKGKKTKQNKRKNSQIVIPTRISSFSGIITPAKSLESSSVDSSSQSSKVNEFSRRPSNNFLKTIPMTRKSSSSSNSSEVGTTFKQSRSLGLRPVPSNKLFAPLAEKGYVEVSYPALRPPPFACTL